MWNYKKHLKPQQMCHKLEKPLLQEFLEGLKKAYSKHKQMSMGGVLLVLGDTLY